MNTEEIVTDLMDRHGTSILRLAYSYVRNKQTAEDLSQEIFIKCYQKMDTFQGESKIETWLYRLAVNHCKDYVKSWHYRKVHVTGVISSLFSGEQASTESQVMKEFAQHDLLEQILALPLKYKEVILLYYFHDFSLKEISEINNLNINTVKTRIVKAKELLKKSISERGEYYGQQNT